jgi:hypothetical protein
MNPLAKLLIIAWLLALAYGGGLAVKTHHKEQREEASRLRHAHEMKPFEPQSLAHCWEVEDPGGRWHSCERPSSLGIKCDGLTIARRTEPCQAQTERWMTWVDRAHYEAAALYPEK